MTDAAPSERPPLGPRAEGLLLTLGYLLLSVVWMFALQCSVGLFAAAQLLASATPGQPPDFDAMAVLGPGLLGGATAVQLLGFAALAWALARSVGWSTNDTFALRRGPGAVFAVAVVGGLTVGFFPGWIAEQLKNLLPAWMNLGNQQMIIEMLTNGTVAGRVVMALAVALAAPLFEELTFRGFLWKATEPIGGKWGAWLLTSAMFALYHMDPVHVLALVPTALFLGWLRMTSGSVWPPILAHFCNNTLAATGALLMDVDTSQSLPWWAALLGLSSTLVFMALAWAFRAPEPGLEEA